MDLEAQSLLRDEEDRVRNRLKIWNADWFSWWYCQIHWKPSSTNSTISLHRVLAGQRRCPAAVADPASHCGRTDLSRVCMGERSMPLTKAWDCSSHSWLCHSVGHQNRYSVGIRTVILDTSSCFQIRVALAWIRTLRTGCLRFVCFQMQ